MAARPEIRAKREAIIERASADSGGLARILAEMERFAGPGGALSFELYAEAVLANKEATRPGRNGEPIPDDRMRHLAMQQWERLHDRCLAYGIGLPVQRIHTTEEKIVTNRDDQISEFRERPAAFLAAEREMRSIRKQLEAEGVIEPEIEA